MNELRKMADAAYEQQAKANGYTYARAYRDGFVDAMQTEDPRITALLKAYDEWDGGQTDNQGYIWTAIDAFRKPPESAR